MHILSDKIVTFSYIFLPFLLSEPSLRLCFYLHVLYGSVMHSMHLPSFLLLTFPPLANSFDFLRCCDISASRKWIPPNSHLYGCVRSTYGWIGWDFLLYMGLSDITDNLSLMSCQKSSKHIDYRAWLSTCSEVLYSLVQDIYSRRWEIYFFKYFWIPSKSEEEFLKIRTPIG